MKKPCCYYCKWWDGMNASNSHRGKEEGVTYAFCKNPEKCRPETGGEICPAIDSDYCTDFEPVEGLTPEWKRIIRMSGEV